MPRARSKGPGGFSANLGGPKPTSGLVPRGEKRGNFMEDRECLDLLGGTRCAVGCAVGGIGSQCGLIGNPILIGVLIVRYD